MCCDFVLLDTTFSEVLLHSGFSYGHLANICWNGYSSEWQITDHTLALNARAGGGVKRVSTGVASQLLHEKAESLLVDKGSRDIFGLLGMSCCSISTKLTFLKSRPI